MLPSYRGNLLQRVLDGVCVEDGVAPYSDEAQAIAALLAGWIDTGETNEGWLMAAVMARELIPVPYRSTRQNAI